SSYNFIRYSNQHISFKTSTIPPLSQSHNYSIPPESSTQLLHPTQNPHPYQNPYFSAHLRTSTAPFFHNIPLRIPIPTKTPTFLPISGTSTAPFLQNIPLRIPNLTNPPAQMKEALPY
ncbi:hypothetical protein Pcinc_035639, partial [Petrolisthes cinctipes]